MLIRSRSCRTCILKVRIPLTAATLFVTASDPKVAFFVVLFLFVSTSTNQAQNLYVIERDDVYGFSDKSGKPVIPPRYGAVKSFSEGLAPVYEVRVSFTVANAGQCAGAEIAELYVGEKNPTVPRPIKELKGFKKVFLQPGESKRVTLELDQRSFAFFDIGSHLWTAKSDIYNILVGASSQDIRLNGQFKLQFELTSKP